MNSTKSLYQPPVPSTRFHDDATLCDNTIRFQYLDNGILHRSGIQFKSVVAIRTRAERCCTAWQVKNSYDTPAVVNDSEWLKEISSDTKEIWRDTWPMHHYMIYLDSVGYFEFIAESWSILPEEIGSWPEI
jgi:hypothetical protein